MRLTYSRKNTMRLLVERIKIFNLIRPHQISQISHFRIKYEYSVSHLKEKISRRVFFPVFFFIPFRCFCDKGWGIFVSSPQSFLLSNTI